MERGLDYHPRQPGYEGAGGGYRRCSVPLGHPLEGLVSEVFVLQTRGEETLSVIPDGCDDLLLLFCGGGVRGYLSPSLRVRQGFSFPAGRLVGVRLLPGATAGLLGEDMAKAAGETVALGELWRDAGQLEETLAAASDWAQGLEALTAYLCPKVRAETGGQRLVRACVAQLWAAGGTCSVEDLARRTGYTSRYLRQIFSSYLGHSPKELAEILRVQRLLALLQDQPNRALGDTALLCGFADQSHMNRACRRYLGAPAGAIRSGAAWKGSLRLPAGRLFR